MTKRPWIGSSLLLALAFILFACGTGSGEENGESSADDPVEEPGTTDENPEDMPEVELTPMIESLSEDAYRYTLANETEEAVTFNFTSGQRFDFSLKNEEGEQVFLLSSVSAYIQALGEETVEPGGELHYEFAVPPLDDLEAGIYRLEAWLTPAEGPAYPAKTEYVVE